MLKELAINQRLRTKLQGINPQRIWRVIKRGFGFLGFGLRLRSKASGEKIREKIDLTKNREKANQKPVRKVGNKPEIPEQGFRELKPQQIGDQKVQKILQKIWKKFHKKLKKIHKKLEEESRKPVRKVGNKPEVPEQGFRKEHKVSKKKRALRRLTLFYGVRGRLLRKHGVTRRKWEGNSYTFSEKNQTVLRRGPMVRAAAGSSEKKQS